LCSGDAVRAIVGLMSVSVNTVLTDICENSLSFSEALRRTYAQGLFEKDVFADLEGTEVAEKMLILLRELGFASTIEDIKIEPLATRRHINDWNCLGDEFGIEDKILLSKALKAKEHNCTLRYLQRIECSPVLQLGKAADRTVKASVRLEEVPNDSQHAMVKGAVYQFSFHTDRYAQNPLVIQVGIVKYL
jgi:homoserine dehydrogenase